jgi:hypothetical protein
MRFHMPTVKDLEVAREIFEEKEPRDLFYRAATELIRLAIEGATSLAVAEAVGVLLQTWNVSFYRFHQDFDSEHFADIEGLLARQHEATSSFRQRRIETLTGRDEAQVMAMFKDFELVLGAVGAAKCLHLLAPSFFPLWDNDIAQGYKLSLKKRGTNAPRYYQFMEVAKRQCEILGGEQALGRNPLKALDEYNYCRYTRKWIADAPTE